MSETSYRCRIVCSPDVSYSDADLIAIATEESAELPSHLAIDITAVEGGVERDLPTIAAVDPNPIVPIDH